MDSHYCCCHAVTQIVYEFLLRYVVSNDTDAKTAKKYIDQFFVVSACAQAELTGVRAGSRRCKLPPSLCYLPCVHFHSYLHYRTGPMISMLTANLCCNR